MKRELVLTCGAVLFAVGGACAAAEDDPPESTPDPGSTLGDAASPDEAGEPDTDALGPDGCSAAGWCATQLPDADLTLKDIWPLPGHAFAIAESPTRGVKVLEWTDAASKWVYIDDNSQNQASVDLYAGKVWAPSADEVYFTVAPRTIYHGKRQNQPSAAWAWAHQQLDDRVPQYPASGDHYRGRPTYGPSGITYTALGVVGTGPDDVYAWYANAIYHLTKSRNGSETWEVEYVADDRDDANEQLFFVSATASGNDDVWFAGGRGGAPGSTGCPVLVHKTAAGYRRVADGEPATGNTSTFDGGLSFDAGLSLDGGLGFPPPLDGGFLPLPFDGGLVPQFSAAMELESPLEQGFDFLNDGGIVLPPSDGGIVLPPPGDGGIVLPPPGDGGIGLPPNDGGGVLPSPNDGGLSLDGGVITFDGGLPVLDSGLPILDGGPSLDGGTSVKVATMCRARVGSILLGSGVGWIPSISAIAPAQVVMLKGGREIVKVAANGNDYAATMTTLPNKPSHVDFVSLFSAPDDDIWLGGPNIILRTSQGLGDGGNYEVSTISLTGAWLETPIHQIRGSSNVDRWAVGARYALHKTTP